MIFFSWKFISLFGGAGPKFYEIDKGHGCSQNWIWHLLMLNNIAPWDQNDYCIEETWYIANDFWFLIVGLNLIEKHRTDKKQFYIHSFLLSLFCLVVQAIMIYHNNIQASYLTYSDEYWTVYYKKPFCHFHSYNMGFVLGSMYFSYKYQDPKDTPLVHKYFD